MDYQVELGRAHVLALLPDDVRARCIWRDSYWLTDEAQSVYTHAAGVLSQECHSPILALARGVPAIYVRQPTDTIKGQMYRDIGMEAGIYEIDSVDGATLGRAALAFAEQAEASRASAQRAGAVARAKLDAAAACVKEALEAYP